MGHHFWATPLFSTNLSLLNLLPSPYFACYLLFSPVPNSSPLDDIFQAQENKNFLNFAHLAHEENRSPALLHEYLITKGTFSCLKPGLQTLSLPPFQYSILFPLFLMAVTLCMSSFPIHILFQLSSVLRIISFSNYKKG